MRLLLEIQVFKTASRVRGRASENRLPEACDFVAHPTVTQIKEVTISVLVASSASTSLCSIHSMCSACLEIGPASQKPRIAHRLQGSTNSGPSAKGLTLSKRGTGFLRAIYSTNKVRPPRGRGGRTRVKGL